MFVRNAKRFRCRRYVLEGIRWTLKPRASTIIRLSRNKSISRGRENGVRLSSSRRKWRCLCLRKRQRTIIDVSYGVELIINSRNEATTTINQRDTGSNPSFERRPSYLARLVSSPFNALIVTNAYIR